MEKDFEESFEGILSFIDTEMKDEEKKKEYYERKFKDSKKLMVVGFQSLSPVKLHIVQEYDMKETSEQIKNHPDVFHPLFISNNITNGQYKKLEGVGTDKLYKKNNSGSFSDYYITRKVLDKVLPNNIVLETSEEAKEKTLKLEILKEFYRLFNEVASTLSQNGEKEVGYDFFIDFNTIIGLHGVSKEQKEAFLQTILDETGVQYSVDYNLFEEKEWVNGLVYLMESIEFQSKQIYGISLEEKTMDDVLQEKVGLPFEVPTNEKPILKNVRTSQNEKEEDIPKSLFFEMILLRMLVIMINKQGTTPFSGYRFLLKEGDDPRTSIEKRMQIVGDKNGNMSVLKIEHRDIKVEHEFLKSIMDNYLHLFGSEMEEDNAFSIFMAKYLSVKDIMMERQPKEKEMTELKWNKRLYKELSRILYDGPFRNIGIRIMNYEEKTNKQVGLFQLLDLLFVIRSLDFQGSKKKERLMFLNRNVNISELIEKEALTKEELYYVLGGIAGITVRSSRNKDSVSKTMLKQTNVKQVLEEINKRFSISLDEIEYLPMVEKWMKVIVSQMGELLEKKQMASDEKFSFITGFLSEVNRGKGKKQEGNNNDK